MKSNATIDELFALYGYSLDGFFNQKIK